jgi:hypothetical protein
MIIILLALIFFTGCFNSNSGNQQSCAASKITSESIYSLVETSIQQQPVRMILKNKQPLTRKEFIDGIGNSELQSLINRDIRSQGKAIYFETTALSESTKNQPFYYSLTPAPALEADGVSADPGTFKKNSVMLQATKQNQTITAFANPSGSARLIVPTLINSHLEAKQTYLSLYQFITGAPEKEIRAFWELWASEAQQRLSLGKTTWMSTHGTGVYWLHGRLDDEPTYYSSVLKNIR